MTKPFAKRSPARYGRPHKGAATQAAEPFGSLEKIPLKVRRTTSTTRLSGSSHEKGGTSSRRRAADVEAPSFDHLSRNSHGRA